MIIYANYVTREMVRQNPLNLFVFEDNFARKGFGGQAKEIRGEPNSVGIPTKKYPSRNEIDYFTNAGYSMYLIASLPDWFRIYTQLCLHKDVIWPRDGIGTGRVDLERRAPLIWKHIESMKCGLEAIK